MDEGGSPVPGEGESSPKQEAKADLAQAAASASEQVKAAGEGGSKLSNDPQFILLTKLSILVGIIFAIIGGITGLIFSIHALTSADASTPHHAHPTPTPLARFVVVGDNWKGPCTNGCSMTATFRNEGGEGTAAATFNIWRNRWHGGSPLATCTVPVPDAPANGAVSAGCTAFSSVLSNLLNANPRGPQVWMTVQVENPTGQPS
jgi:hypothetical protein